MQLELLEEMLAFDSVVGNEQALAVWLLEQLRPHADRVEIDRMGNVFAWRGDDPAVAIFCHMDSVGFIVDEVRGDHLSVVKLGGPRVPDFAPVVVSTASGPLPGTLLGDGKKIRIDLWDEAAGEKVRVGDVAAFAPNFAAHDGLIRSRWLDNKLGCWVALESFKRAERAFFVATIREEHRPPAAGAAARRLDGLELALVLDITYAASPGDPYMIEWGKGPAVTLLDSIAHDRRWARRLLDVAAEHEIPAQPEVVTSGGSDAAWILQEGIPAIFMGIPIRYAHTPAEIARLEDCERAVDLIGRFIERYPDGRPAEQPDA